MTLNIFTALAFVVGGLALLYRQMLLSGRNGSFPCAPWVVRSAMFVCGVGTVWLGVMFGRASAVAFAGQAAPYIATVAAFVACYQMALLLNLFAERRPPRYWRAIDRLNAASGGRTSPRFHSKEAHDRPARAGHETGKARALH